MASHAERAAHQQGPWYLDNGKRPGIRGFLDFHQPQADRNALLVAVLSFFTVAVTLGVLMRIQMLSPDSTFLSGQAYNAMFTLHGIIMIFLVVIPGIPTIFGNFFLPILIGGRDMAFPRLNLFSWYLYMTGGGVVLPRSLAFGRGPSIRGGRSTCPTACTAR